MISLLWKDFRLNRSILLIGFLAVLAPYAALTFGVLRAGADPDGVRDWSRISQEGLFYAAALSLLIVSLLGGNALASERPDRSCEFLACLPPRPWEHVASKAANALGGIAGVTLLNAVLAFSIARITGNDLSEELSQPFLPIVASIGGCLFGVAWLVSAVAPGPAIPTVLSFVAPLSIAAILSGISIESTHYQNLFIAASYLTGGLAFAAGALIFALRRCR